MGTRAQWSPRSSLRNIPALPMLRTVPGRKLLANTPCMSTGSSLMYWPWLRFSQWSPPSVERMMPPTSMAP